MARPTLAAKAGSARPGAQLLFPDRMVGRIEIAHRESAGLGIAGEDRRDEAGHDGGLPRAAIRPRSHCARTGASQVCATRNCGSAFWTAKTRSGVSTFQMSEATPPVGGVQPRLAMILLQASCHAGRLR